MPITGEAVLLTMAQIGLGFAGFGSLVLTLRHRSDEWSPREVAGLKLILEHCFGLVFLALLPPLLQYSEYWAERTVWRISNAVMAGAIGLLLLTQILRVWKGKVKSAYPTLLFVLYIIPAFFFTGLELYKVIDGSIFCYGLGLMFLLTEAAIQFWIFLTVYTKSEA